MPAKPLSWMTRTVSLPPGHPARALLRRAAAKSAPPEVVGDREAATAREAITGHEAAADVVGDVAVAAPQPAGPPEALEIPVPVLAGMENPRERAEFLLHTAAEVEHALMAQYLCASFSLGPPFEGGVPAGVNANALANRWRGLLLRTAREEMGHLITVENLLRLIGGRINLEREDFPFRRDLYPFPFTLEPLSPVSLAKYVAAEMPEVQEPSDELRRIIDAATQGASMAINRVGVLYALLTAIFSRPEDVETFAASGDPWLSWVGVINEAANSAFAGPQQHLADEDFHPETASAQASPDDWGGDSQLFVRVVTSRDEATDALREIALQGEGLPPGQGPPADSHFERFLGIRREFPLNGEWRPARSVAVNPSLPRPAEPTTPDTITNERSQKWARLFDLRYAILLHALAHFLEIEGALYVAAGQQKGDRTPRGHLHLWVFNEMRRLHKIGRKLSQLPRRADAADPARAGATFTLPSMLTLPPGEAQRWALHHDHFRDALALVGEMLQAGSPDANDPFLASLLTADEEDRAVAGSQAAGAQPPAQPTEFRKVVRILDESVRGLPVRRHGPFWRNVDRDAFIAQTPMGLPLLVAGDGSSSNLVRVLRGELGGFPRMPVARPQVPPPRVEFIEEWIDRGCPDNDPPGAVGVVPEPDPRPEPSP